MGMSPFSVNQARGLRETSGPTVLTMGSLPDGYTLTRSGTGLAGVSLIIGTNVQAWDADLDTWATKTAPSGAVVGTTDSQALTNKTLTSPVVNTPTGIKGSDLTSVATLNFTSTTVAGTVTILSSDTTAVYKVDTSAARTVNLPAASTVSGRIYWFKDSIGTANTNNITIVPNGTDKIDGLNANKVVSANWGSWMFYSDGSNWYIVG